MGRPPILLPPLRLPGTGIFQIESKADQLFFDQIIEAAAASEEIQQAAQVNSVDKFALLFNRMGETLFVERMDQNETIFARYMNDPDFQKVVSQWLVNEVYRCLSKSDPKQLYYPSKR
jgi:type I restriction enzyme R subunit